MTCPRSHGDLKYRNPDTALEDLPREMQRAYADAVERGCGCDKVQKTMRVRDEAS